jgi:hypothetical protein
MRQASRGLHKIGAVGRDRAPDGRKVLRRVSVSVFGTKLGPLIQRYATAFIDLNAGRR